MNYHIYQTDADYSFRGWDDITKIKFNFADYHRVYYGNIIDDYTKDDNKILEELYETFNINHPKDYHARSLSVSDVVKIVRDNTIRYYYCDNIGWQLISSEQISK